MSETPIYQLLVDHFLDDDTLHYADEKIEYDGEPSEHMAPLNEAARVRMRAMLDRLDEASQRMASIVGRPHTGRLTDLADLLAQAASDQKVLAERAQAEMLRRALPTVPDKPPPVRPDMMPLADRRRATMAKTTVRSTTPPPKQVRGAEAIHRTGHDRLTEKAPIEGG